MNREDLRDGMGVFWLKESRGGYGFVTHVPAVVVRITAHRATIEFEAREIGAKHPHATNKLRASVKFTNLRPRELDHG